MSRIYLSPPHVGPLEREMLLDAFDSNWIAPLGPHVDAFESEMCARIGVRHGAALSSGTAGLHLALLLGGVKPGDEVLVSTFTFAATANAVIYVGARPVFVDSDLASWNMDPALLAEELDACARRGKVPKAVIAVDLYGQCPDLARISEICSQYGVLLIEDAAEALGATCHGRPAGGWGELAVFSFNGNKIITTSGGGMLVSNHRDWIEKARFLATQARDPAPHYEHSQIGYNYRMSNLLAALGRAQLKSLDERVAARRAHNAYYRAALKDTPGVAFMPEAAHGRATFWLTCITIDEAEFGVDHERVRQHLATLDIEARPLWKPMHLQPVFRDCRARGGDVSAGMFAHGLCLPSGSNLNPDDRDKIAAGVLSSRRK